MKLLVGLGNPGPEYAKTRHNYGFMIVDELATTLSATFTHDSRLNAGIAKTEIDGTQLLIAKPQTFMNLSGDAVGAIARYYKIEVGDIWVAFDDVDVPFGKLRLRIGGSSGHQGIRSITAHVGPDFIQARAGISLNDRTRQRSEDYVLQQFNSTEKAALPEMVARAAEIIADHIARPSFDETTFELTPSDQI